jgi:flagellum-specific peptidoglycan hydrolase FlgJ
MINKIILLIVMLFFCINVNATKITPTKITPTKITPKEYIDKYKILAVELMYEYNIPASIILGISILESGYGTSTLSKSKNNYFGIKIPGKNTYEYYENDEESFSHFCEFTAKKKYYTILTQNDVMDYKIWIKKIQDSGYARSEIWDDKVIKCIEQYKLYEIDKAHIGEDGSITFLLSRVLLF